MTTETKPQVKAGKCPNGICGRDVPVAPGQQIGDPVVCPICTSMLKVTGLNPPTFVKI